VVSGEWRVESGEKGIDRRGRGERGRSGGRIFD